MDDFLEERNNFGAWNYLVSSNGSRMKFNSTFFYPLNPAKIFEFWFKRYISGKRIFPVTILYRTQNKCSDNCFFCQTRALRSQNQNTSFDFLKKSIIELDKNIISIRFDGLGEPFLIPSLKKLLDLADKRNILTSIISNGTTFIKDDIEEVAKHAKFIRFSLDAVSENTHNLVHRPHETDSFKKRIAQIKKLCRIRQKMNPKCIVGGHFVISKINYKEILPFTKLIKKIGADFVDFCLLKNNEMLVHGSVVGIQKQVKKHIEEAKGLTDDNFHLLYRENSSMDKKKLLEYIRNRGVCWHSLFMPVINSKGKLITCGKYEESVNNTNTKEKGKFKSIYCQNFGPCYFTYFNFVADWVRKEVEVDQNVIFSRALVNNAGKIIKYFDKIN